MLESVDRKTYGEDYDAAVLEQWKTCVEMANSNTDKRNNANNLFITINSALFAVITFAWDYKSILLSVIGIIVCALWFTTIRSYRQLSSVKYHIVNEIEKQLPLAPFTHEWEKLQHEHKYVGLTKIENVLPWLFLVMYTISITVPVFNALLKLLCPCTGGNV